MLKLKQARTFCGNHSTAVLLSALALGTAVRLAVLLSTRDLTTRIADEQQYVTIADNIFAGNGFAWGPNTPTSMRPPLYPGLLAGMWMTAGPDNLQAVRVVQIVLALATAALVYVLAARLFNPVAGRTAAALFWLYPSFIYSNFLILTETLFTFLLVLFIVLSVELVERSHPLTAFGCGLSLGLAALTRSVLWPMPIVLCPLLALLIRRPLSRRLLLSVIVFAGYAIAVMPWAIRNTRVQGVVTVVDTMGGINLRMGNYEYTPDDRMWDAVSLTGAQSWVHGYRPDYPGQVVTEGMKDKWAQRQAIEYMREHPAQTIRRSLIKFADFWGLEREFIAGVQKGFYAPPLWFTAAATGAMLLGYVFVVTAGFLGLWLVPPRDWRAQVIVLLPAVVILAGHTLAFGHSRYHLPLIPIIGVYAAALLTSANPLAALRPRANVLGAAASVAVLIVIWFRQIAIVDLPRIKSLLDHLG